MNGPSGPARHPGNANIRFTEFSAHDILGALQPHLAASTGSACTSGTPEPSHVLKAIGLSGDEAESSIRFSLGFDTSDEDVEAAVELIEAAYWKNSPPSSSCISFETWGGCVASLPHFHAHSATPIPHSP